MVDFYKQWAEVLRINMNENNTATFILPISYQDWKNYQPFTTRRGGGDNVNPGLTPWDSSWNAAYVVVNFTNSGGNAHVLTVGFLPVE